MYTHNYEDTPHIPHRHLPALTSPTSRTALPQLCVVEGQFCLGRLWLLLHLFIFKSFVLLYVWCTHGDQRPACRSGFSLSTASVLGVELSLLGYTSTFTCWAVSGPERAGFSFLLLIHCGCILEKYSNRAACEPLWKLQPPARLLALFSCHRQGLAPIEGLTWSFPLRKHRGPGACWPSHSLCIREYCPAPGLNSSRRSPGMKVPACSRLYCHRLFFHLT